MIAPLTAALVGLLDRAGGTWQGTTSDLLQALTDSLPPDLAALDAPRFSARLRTDTPTLTTAGIEVQPPDGCGRSGRIWTIRRAGAAVPADPRPKAPQIVAEAAMPTTAAMPEQIAAARTAMTRALLAGADSRGPRAALNALEDRSAREAATEAAAAAAVQRQRQAAIQARATDLATAAAARLGSLMGALQPPPAPRS